MKYYINEIIFSQWFLIQSDDDSHKPWQEWNFKGYASLNLGNLGLKSAIKCDTHHDKGAHSVLYVQIL